MGNSQKKESNFEENFTSKMKEMIKEKKKFENSLIENEIQNEEIQRGNKKIKYELNIYVYSDNPIESLLKSFLENYNKNIFDWKYEFIEEFSKKNSDYLIDIFKKNYREKKFRNVLIIPINSIEQFNNSLKNDDKNILRSFSILNPEQQPFVLFLDYNQADFSNKRIFIQFHEEVKGKDIFLDTNIINKYLELQRRNKDFELEISLLISKSNQISINTFKNLILKKKNNHDSFEIIINEVYFYQLLFDKESSDINDFLQIFQQDNIENFQISLTIINLQSKLYEEIFYYEKLFNDISDIQFIQYKFKKRNIIHLLEKYTLLDERNFSFLRTRKSIKNQLIKYASFYNQFGDILFCEQTCFYPVKINVAVGGYIGCGKSTLINTILQEKRCLEGQGCSQTNYVSQYTLKDYAINFIDFPGFRASQNGVLNTTLFVENVKNKISDMKRTNEAIHCFLFCIKYEDRLFEEKDKEMKNIFDTIFKLKIKTFFIVTQSEEEDSEDFIRYRDNIINQFLEIKKNYSEDLVRLVFGEDLEKQIIPIFALKKKFHKQIINPFGLDKLFEALYDYFQKKRITIEVNQLLNDNNIQELIKDNELLNIFESKKQLMNGLELRMEKEVTSFIFKYFLIAPKILYTFDEKEMENFMIDVLERVFHLYKYFIQQQNNMDKLRVFNSMPLSEENLKEMQEKIKNEFPQLILEGKKEMKSKIPWYLKAIFPILSPIYYIIGTPVIAIFSKKLTKLIMNEIWPLTIKEQFSEYFINIINSFNKAIDDLYLLKNKFEKNYLIKKLSLKIKEDEIKNTFNLLDPNKKGFAPKDKIKETFLSLEESLKDEEIDNFLSKYSKENQVNYKKLIEVLFEK